MIFKKDGGLWKFGLDFFLKSNAVKFIYSKLPHRSKIIFLEKAVLDPVLNSEWEDLLSLEFLMDSYRGGDEYQDDILKIVVQVLSEYPYNGLALLQFPQVFCKFPHMLFQVMNKVTEFDIGEYVQADPSNTQKFLHFVAIYESIT